MAVWFTVSLLLGASPEGPVGARPYEMDRAGRTENPYPPLVDFENLDGWTVETQNAEARFERTREQQLWGRYVGKLSYRATGSPTRVRLIPPAPLACPDGFDTVAWWIYGNNWGWVSDPTTPRVTLILIFRATDGREVAVHAQHVDSMYWFLCYRQLTTEQRAALATGAVLTAIEVAGGTNPLERSLWLDDLSLLREELAPLTFKPRPERGIAMFPGQDTGTNTGPGRLPFPTREETVLPRQLAGEHTTELRAEGGTFVFEYRGEDGRLRYRLEPKTGTWDDWTAEWVGRQGPFQPCVGGGVWLVGPNGAVRPERAEPLGTRRVGQTVQSAWRLIAGDSEAEATFTYRLLGKSLVMDVRAGGQSVAEVRYGRAAGLSEARAVQVPYYVYSPGRPMLLVAGRDRPLFLMGNSCWYRSNASELFGSLGDEAGAVGYNGGARYIAKTDGRRNDVFERFFLTVSPRMEEVFPVVDNPPSPYKAVTGGGVWRAHGAGNRESDAAFFRRAHRLGLRHLIITDHETMWRDEGESFTFRDYAAPGKGGDQGAFDYARLMQDTLGFVYGPYNNYTDFATVNAHWSPDRVNRWSDGSLQGAWPRCYAPKPAYAVEACAALAPRIQEKFRFSTAYCDVHTAIPPWSRTDYDARVPGAGTFAATFYAWGEIMMHQRAAWGGPVYSEGNHHVFLHGLTDGNYAQDQSGQLHRRPWLVDFDLRSLHDLGCNFGMGNVDMFYSNSADWGTTRESRDAVIDRFLTATVAYGHPGFLAYEGGEANALRSYYLIQQLATRYAPTPVDTVRYLDAEGRGHDSSTAVATGVYERNQIVSRYANGCVTVANGSPTERLRARVDGRLVDLPPNGFAGWTADGAMDVRCGDADGHRADYAATPEYLYVDGRGRFTRFARAAGDGIGICRRDGDGWEIIPYAGASCGFAVGGGEATALNEAGDAIGPAEIRVARGLTYVMPVDGAFSYRLTPAGGGGVTLTCDRERVVPGEVVTVRGRQAHPWPVPGDAKPGDRLWMQAEGSWIDFTVVPLADLAAELVDDGLRLTVRPNLSRRQPGELTLGDARPVRVDLRPDEPRTVTLPLALPTAERLARLTVRLTAGNSRLEREWWLRSARGLRRLADLSWAHSSGIRVRGGEEIAAFGGSGAQCNDQRMACGGDEKPGLFMHPPYQEGVGYTFALLEPPALPDEPVSFRCLVGKRDGSDPGDGVQFRVAVVAADGRETEVARQVVDQHRWDPLEADLSPWQGQVVRLKLIADVGDADNSTGDWACWAEARLETREEVLYHSLHEPDAARGSEPGPQTSAVSLAELAGARAAWLHFEGAGLEGTEQYPTFALVNRVDCGRLPAANGDEARGYWSDPLALPLPATVAAGLRARNVVEVFNPGQDYFKVRRFWLEAELADGRRVGSRIATGTFTQPPGWQYAEGEGVPQGRNITVEVWFEIAE